MLDSNRSEDGPAQLSSKLSLGSSPSVLSAEEPLDGDGPLTPTDRIDDVEELFAYHEDSPEPLSNESTDIDNDAGNDDDLHSASSLSSVPDDFPLSPSSSPEPAEVFIARKRKKNDEDMGEEDCPDDEDERDEEGEVNPSKRQKQDCDSQEETNEKGADTDQSEENHPVEVQDECAKDIEERKSKKRRASKPLEAGPRRRRRTSKDSISGPDMDKDENIPENVEETGDGHTVDEKVLKSEGDKLEKELVKETRTKSNKTSMNEVIGSDTGDNDGDHDYQHRHKEAFDALTHIEIEFARLRDKMYQEKMAELNEEATMIANGTHPELVALMEEIEEKKGQRIKTAEAWRKHQHESFQQQFEGFEYQANSQKSALRREIITSINGKRWMMDDERGKLNEGTTSQRLVPNTNSMLLHKRQRKEESSELQDIKEAIGFPMAPKPSGLSTKDIRDDLAALGVGIHTGFP
ncbi:Transcriptional regulatory protein [Apophysomyces sp. BC1034]|nr:Transcriptional regulatory protein [Apophysomyces sp. BC1021]KAG0186769.1 Transcriptional regulatory protein [Apophysomyces sp. BC1034]